METTMYIFWAIAIVGFGILEGTTFQLVSVWFMIGSVAGLIASICNAPLTLQLIIAFAVSLVSLLLTRPLVKKYIKPKVQSTNADRCIGENAIVLEDIDNIHATGCVKIHGKEWTARSTDGNIIPQGRLVRVEKIEGVKLIVSLIQ